MRAAFEEAAEAFRKGGVDGWQTSAARIRTCLDRWEGTTKGKDVTFGHDDPLHVRMRKLRQAVREVTHYAHHETAAQWTREDALVLLAATAALLAREGL